MAVCLFGDTLFALTLYTIYAFGDADDSESFNLLQAALASLEQEAKDNVYAVLDPHIQYEITINKHGEPPKYLSLSKPIAHQRTQEFDPHYVRDKEVNNNGHDVNDNRFSTFKGPVKSNIRRSNRSSSKIINSEGQRKVCKYNNDVEYTTDPYFGVNVSTSNFDNLFSQDNNDGGRYFKTYTRMYERNNSGRSQKLSERKLDKESTNVRRESNRSKKTQGVNENAVKKDDANDEKYDRAEDFKPRPGKVREIASRFNQYSGNLRNSFRRSKVRPKPIQIIGNQAYLDHIFPDAVEI